MDVEIWEAIDKLHKDEVAFLGIDLGIYHFKFEKIERIKTKVMNLMGLHDVDVLSKSFEPHETEVMVSLFEGDTLKRDLWKQKRMMVYFLYPSRKLTVSHSPWTKQR